MWFDQYAFYVLAAYGVAISVLLWMVISSALKFVRAKHLGKKAKK